MEKKIFIPVFEPIKKLKLFQDFDPETGEFRFGFILPTKDEDGNIIGNDVWCITPAGMKNRKDLEYSGDVILSDFGSQIDIRMLECFKNLPEIKDEEINYYVNLLGDNFSIFQSGDIGGIGDNFIGPISLKGLVTFKHILSNIMSPMSPLLSELSQCHLCHHTNNTDNSTNTNNNNLEINNFEITKKKGGNAQPMSTLSPMSPFLSLSTTLEQWESDLNIFFSNDVNFKDFYITPQEITFTLFKVVKDIINFYVDYKDEQEGASTFYALYLMTTYLYRLFDNFGYILFVGQKRSGKTKNLTLAQCIAWNPISSGNISPPSLFRIIDSLQPTLILDETDLIAKYKADLYQLLLSGATKNFPAVRTEEKGKMRKFLVPKTFDVFSPKIMAGISGFDEILEDRCLKIIMVRSRDEKAYREVNKDNPLFNSLLKPLLLAWAISFHQLVNYIYKNLPVESEVLNPRELQFFKPVLAVAYLCGPDIYKQALNYLEFKSEERVSEEEIESLDILVLKLLVYQWESRKKDFSIPVKELSDMVSATYDLEATPRKIAGILKRLKFSEKFIRMGRIHFIIRKSMLEELLRDYFLKWNAIIDEFKEKGEEIPEIETLSSQKDIILKTIRQLCSIHGGEAPLSEIVKSIEAKLNLDQEKIDSVISKLMQEGVIYEPRHGFISVVISE
jgi:hypothetical protein